MYTVKVAVVGPSQAGKTMISNFLADATENIGGDMMMNATTESLGGGGSWFSPKSVSFNFKTLAP